MIANRDKQPLHRDKSMVIVDLNENDSHINFEIRQPQAVRNDISSRSGSISDDALRDTNISKFGVRAIVIAVVITAIVVGSLSVGLTYLILSNKTYQYNDNPLQNQYNSLNNNLTSLQNLYNNLNNNLTNRQNLENNINNNLTNLQNLYNNLNNTLTNISSSYNQSPVSTSTITWITAICGPGIQRILILNETSCTGCSGSSSNTQCEFCTDKNNNTIKGYMCVGCNINSTIGYCGYCEYCFPASAGCFSNNLFLNLNSTSCTFSVNSSICTDINNSSRTGSGCWSCTTTINGTNGTNGVGFCILCNICSF